MRKLSYKIISLILAFTLLFQQTGLAYLLPQPLLVPLQLPVLRYLSVNTANPSNYFNFLMDRGQRTEDGSQSTELNSEATKLIHYFFLGLTLPSESFWVNLKPQEPERITSEELSRTDLGRTLLEQDLKLKKDIANYLHPKHPQGKLYWERLYQALEHEGKKASATNRGGPAKNNGWKKATITSSSRVWIVPAEAVVLETEDGALVAKATLKVLLESEYLSLDRKTKELKNRKTEKLKNEEEQIRIISENLMKEIILPGLTKDINESPGYAPLRQVYHSLILAEWYKRKHSKTEKLKNERTNPYTPYINSGTTTGLESELPWEKQAIWQEYLKSYQEGEYKLQDTIFGLKRMYFSGGVILDMGSSPITIKPGTIDTIKEYLQMPVSEVWKRLKIAITRKGENSVLSPEITTLDEELRNQKAPLPVSPLPALPGNQSQMDASKKPETDASPAESPEDKLLNEINDVILGTMFNDPKIITALKTRPIKIRKFIPGVISPLSEIDYLKSEGSYGLMLDPYISGYGKGLLSLRATEDEKETKRILSHELGHAVVEHLVGENINAGINEAYGTIGELIVGGDEAKLEFNYFEGHFGHFYIYRKDTYDISGNRRKYDKEYERWKDQKRSESGNEAIYFRFSDFVFEKIAEDFLKNTYLDAYWANAIIARAREDMRKYGEPIHYIGKGIVNAVLVTAENDLQKTARAMGALLLEPSTFQGLDIFSYIERARAFLKEFQATSVQILDSKIGDGSNLSGTAGSPAVQSASPERGSEATSRRASSAVEGKLEKAKQYFEEFSKRFGIEGIEFGGVKELNNPKARAEVIDNEIYVNLGWIDKMSSDEIERVIAHEIQHTRTLFLMDKTDIKLGGLHKNAEFQDLQHRIGKLYDKVIAEKGAEIFAKSKNSYQENWELLSLLKGYQVYLEQIDRGISIVTQSYEFIEAFEKNDLKFLDEDYLSKITRGFEPEQGKEPIKISYKDLESSLSAIQKDTGGIDLSQIELTLKDDKYISSLNPADIKILRAAKALKEEWNSLSLLYIHELILLLKDNLASEIQNKNLLSQVLRQLQSQKFLDPQAIQFLKLIQAQKPIVYIKIAL